MRHKSHLPIKNNASAKKNKGYIIYGERCCLSVIKNKSREIYETLVTKQTDKSIIKILQENDIENIKTVEKAYLNRLCPDSGRHQDIVIKAGPLLQKLTLENHLKASANKHLSCFLLDSIQDPHNIGAIIRSSYCFAMDFIVASERNMPSVNATIVRTSTGLSEILPIYIFPNLTRAIEILQKYNFWIFGLENSENASYLDKSLHNFEGNKAFILGSEGYGISKNLKNHCDNIIKIPIKDNSDSLNVSNAAAIVAYQNYLNSGER